MYFGRIAGWKSEKFMKETLERWIHLNMCLIGGFIGGFSVLNHSDLFGSAQTANMITIILNILGRNPFEVVIRIVGLMLYVLGLASTVMIPRIFKANMKVVSVFVDAVAIIAIVLLPENTHPFVALYPVFVAMSIQWCSFPGAEGYTASCIFSTNNLRQCVTAWTEYACTKKKSARKKAVLYGKVLLSFHVGVAIAYLTCVEWGIYGAWVCVLPLVTAMILVHIEEKRGSVWWVRLWLGRKKLCRLYRVFI